MQKKTSAVGRPRPAGMRWMRSFEPADFMRDWYDAVSEWQASWGEMIDRWPGAMPSAMPRRSERCRGCERCDSTDCHCDCCVNDADLVVQAHAGERRVVPVVVENNTSRPTEVRAELSAFRT